MFDWFLHLIGLCPDHSAHLNFLDYIAYIGTGILTVFFTFFKVIFHKLFHRKCECKTDEILKQEEILNEQIKT